MLKKIISTLSSAIQRFVSDKPLSTAVQEKSRNNRFLLFLDFDGVLHPKQKGSFCCLPLLYQVLDSNPEVDIVISSTWRSQYSFASIQQFFAPEFRHRVVGQTPWLTNFDPNTGSREQEILAYLNQASEQASGFVALDDEPKIFSPNCSWLILTEYETGMTAKTVTELNALITKLRHPKVPQ